MKHVEPVIGLIAFLQSNLELKNKISPSESIVCFVNIRADACTAAQKAG